MTQGSVENAEKSLLNVDRWTTNSLHGKAANIEAVIALNGFLDHMTSQILVCIGKKAACNFNLRTSDLCCISISN